MPKTIWATVRQGRIELSEQVNIPDGTRLLVTILPNDELEVVEPNSESALLKQLAATEAVVWSPHNAHEAAHILSGLLEAQRKEGSD